MIPLLVLQALIGLGPFTAAWDQYPIPSATLRLYVDGVPVGDVSATLNAEAFSAPGFGAHELALSAIVAGVESDKLKIAFTTAAPQVDPACLAPLGSHAPAIFPNTVTLTTGKPGSPAALNFLVRSPDPVVELAIQIDGVDQLPIGRAVNGDLRAFTGLGFLTPAVGTHTMSMRVVTSFGCILTRSAASLVVKP